MLAQIKSFEKNENKGITEDNLLGLLILQKRELYT